MSKTTKRPTRSKQPWEKMHAITRVKNGESKAAVARSIDVPESTLRGWCKNSDKIEATTRQPSSSPASGASASGASTEVPDTQANKRIKIDDNSQPQNLSVKNSPPGPSEINANYQSAIDLSRTSPQASTGRAENGMMMNPQDFSKYYTAARVFQALQQAQGMSLLAGNNGGSLLTQPTSPPSLLNAAPVKLPNERIPPDESVRHWLNTSNPSQLSPNSASATLSTPFNGPQTTSPIAGNTPEQQTLYLEWYKAMISRVSLGAPFNMPMPSSTPNIPILYNQLMQNNGERSAPLSYPATPRQPAAVSNPPQEEFDVPEMHCNAEAQKPGSPLSTGTCRDKNARSPSITARSPSITAKSPSISEKSGSIGRKSPHMSGQSTSGSPRTSDESPSTSNHSPSTSIQSSADQMSSVDMSLNSARAQECQTPKIQSPGRSEKAKKPKKSILENLVSDLKENVGSSDENSEVCDITETIAIGEKFVQCLENTSHPAVTAFQLKQIKSILASVTAAVEFSSKRKRKNE